MKSHPFGWLFYISEVVIMRSIIGILILGIAFFVFLKTVL